MSVKHRLLCGAAVALAAGTAHAQTTQQLQQQIQQLQQQFQQQLQALQDQLNAQAQQQQHQAAPTVAAAPAPGPHVTQSAGNRFGLESADGRYSMALTGRLHFDLGGYPDFHTDSTATTPHDLNAGINARRARLGIVGKFDGDWNYAFIYDFGGSSDGFNASVPSGGSGLGVSGGFLSGIENAYITYNGLNTGPVPLAFDFGYQDTPFTLDEATSSNDIMFMERASSQAIATALASGDNRSAFGVRSGTDRYWAGVYVTGPTAGAAHNVGEPLGAFGRFTVQALQAPDYSLHVGVDAEGLLKPATVTAAATGTTGPVTSALQTLTLSDRPELRIDPTSLLSAAFGSAANPVTGGSTLGVETAGGYQNLFFQGEGYNYRISRLGLPDNNFWGGYLESSWTITGEHRTYIPATGAYSGINPAHPFSLATGGWGAFELAARMSYMDLNDNFDPKHAAAPAPAYNGVEGGRQTIYALGLNWYINPNMRLMFDWLHGTVKKEAATAASPQTGADFDAVAMRAQVAF